MTRKSLTILVILAKLVSVGSGYSQKLVFRPEMTGNVTHVSSKLSLNKDKLDRIRTQVGKMQKFQAPKTNETILQIKAKNETLNATNEYFDSYPFLNNSNSNTTSNETLILVFPWHTNDFKKCHICKERSELYKFRHLPVHEPKGTPFVYQLPSSCGNCWISNNKNLQTQADSILIDNTFTQTYLLEHGVGRLKKQGIHKWLPDLQNRNKKQYWISWMRESAAKGYQNLAAMQRNDSLISKWDQSFNLTCSYRRDSDIFRPFENLQNFFYRKLLDQTKFNAKTPLLKDIPSTYFRKLMQNKYKYGQNTNTAWAVSNCGTTIGAKKRMTYAKEMIKMGLKLDAHGDCFTNTKFDRKTERRLLSKNKFYLAFENGIHCKDYISEKLWRNGFEDELVPITFGPTKSDILAVAPDNSFIHTDDFSNIEKLVNYIDYLDRNDTAYLEFHMWRTQVPDLTDYDTKIRNAEATMLCNTCKKVNALKNNGRPTKVVKSVSKWWWFDMVDDECTGKIKQPFWMRNL